MMKVAIAAIVAISAMSAKSYAFNEWNVNGASCVADAGSIQGNLYIGSGGTVKFATGKTGDIVLYCPVSFNLGWTPTLVGLTYYDDTSAAGNHVKVQLIRMDMSTGGLSVIETVDSDSGFVSSGGSANTVAGTFTSTYDPNNYAYYLRIDLIRNSTSATETVYGVALQD